MPALVSLKVVGAFSDDKIMVRWEPVGKTKDLEENGLAHLVSFDFSD